MATAKKRRRSPLQVLRQEKVIRATVRWDGDIRILEDGKICDSDDWYRAKDVRGTLDQLRDWAKAEAVRIVKVNERPDSFLEIHFIKILIKGDFGYDDDGCPWEEGAIASWESEHLGSWRGTWTYPKNLRELLNEAD